MRRRSRAESEACSRAHLVPLPPRTPVLRRSVPPKVRAIRQRRSRSGHRIVATTPESVGVSECSVVVREDATSDSRSMPNLEWRRHRQQARRTFAMHQLRRTRLRSAIIISSSSVHADERQSTSTVAESVCVPCSSSSSFSSAAPPPPMLHGCDVKRTRGDVGDADERRFRNRAGRSDSTIADHTSPRLGLQALPVRLECPSTARTVSWTGVRLRPNKITVGVPWPGM